MTIDFSPTDGTARCLHSDLIPLQSIGTLTVRRASSVEFNEQTQQWEVHHATKRVQVTVFPPKTWPVILFKNPSRQACLDWEEQHFEELL